MKHAKDTFEQGDESTWYKEPPPENGEESDFAKKSSKPFEEFNQQGGKQEHQGLLRAATAQQEAANGPTFGQQAAEALTLTLTLTLTQP